MTHCGRFSLWTDTSPGLAAAVCEARAVSRSEADLTLAGGKIRTPAHPSGFVSALAVRGGVIAAVGSDDEIRELTGRRTRVIDLRGRLALPAFGDAHVHPVSGGLRACAATWPACGPGTSAWTPWPSTVRPCRPAAGCSAAAGPCRPSPAACRRPMTWTR